MIPKESKLYSVVHQKCPRCHEGNMFSHGNFSPKFAEMNATCPVCGFNLIQEPAYYFGAMYFSYAIQVAVFTAVYLVLRFTIDPEVNVYVWTIIAASLILLPWNFRVSRVAWINLFYSYRGSGE